MELKLPEQIDVIDITMRDGLQNEEHYVPLEAKLYLADRLIKAGFKRLEVGSISHVAYVPQFKGRRRAAAQASQGTGCGVYRSGPHPQGHRAGGGLLTGGPRSTGCSQARLPPAKHTP